VTATASGDQVIALPKGGGALRGIGEKFAPDLHTGTGNFSVPLELPPGRNGLQPQLQLTYSTGNPNGPFGLGWALSVPGVRQKTSKGVPRYDDGREVFILSGAEDLVPVSSDGEGKTTYRPRTEGLFARIVHHREKVQPEREKRQNYWEVRTKDGLVSLYGTPRPADAPQDWKDPAVIADPDGEAKIFGWNLTETTDPFENRIEYEYERDEQPVDGPHRWDQLRLRQVRYVDYGEPPAQNFLVTVDLEYEPRPDPFSDYRAGFEIRTVKRCKAIRVSTHADATRLSRVYRLRYADAERLLGNSLSLLSEIQVEGRDDERPADERSQHLPPLQLGYTAFEPERRRYRPLTAIGDQFPDRSLAHPEFDLVDLFGNGLPCVLQLNGVARYWRNLGEGRFDRPRLMREAPEVSLEDPGVQIVDIDGDSRADLLVANGTRAGYYTMSGAGWHRRRFVPYREAPSIALDDPDVKLMDVDGDGAIDAVRSGASFELFRNDREHGWNRIELRPRRRLEEFPDVTFSDPRVKLADMTGDGLQDIVLVHDGRVDYWPSMGHGHWGRRITMKRSPRFDEGPEFRPYGYDPKRLLLADLDDDGCADLVYVGSGHITMWSNQSGNGWSEPITIRGTPSITEVDSVRIADVEGTGPGILWTYDLGTQRGSTYKFLDLTGETKPYLLSRTDNGMGARTEIDYAPSTRFFLEDEKQPQTRWKTTLPFPVQVVARVRVIDHLSRSKLTTEYSYHHGYWDGAEQEFRGFARVDQRDTEVFERYNDPGTGSFEPVPAETFSPPTEMRTWFHQGPVGPEEGAWHELDLRGEYWDEDPPMLSAQTRNPSLDGLARRAQRDALRTLSGRILRTELYAHGGGPSADRPYSVTEHRHGVMPLPLGKTPPDEPEPWQQRIFFPHAIAERITRWERGEEPMTRYTVTAPRASIDANGAEGGDFDAYGQPGSQISVAIPRRTNPATGGTEPYLATQTVTERAYADDPKRFIVDRVARSTSYELNNDGKSSVAELVRTADDLTRKTLLSQTVNFYDGLTPFKGLDFGELGRYGARVRTESLVMTDAILEDAYRCGDTVLDPPELPSYLDPTGARPWGGEYPSQFRTLPRLAGYTHPVPAGAPSSAHGYWAASERCEYDFQGVSGTGRGLKVASMDALGRKSQVSFESPYDVLPLAATDAARLVTRASNDYRVVGPREVSDPNGNRTSYAYTPLGLLASVAVMGKEGEAVGDTDALPGTRYGYDFGAFRERGQPISVRTIGRVHHASSAIPPPARDATIEQVEYSDGFGRLIQARARAEDTVFGEPGPDGALPARGEAGLPLDQSQLPFPADGIKRTDPEPNVTVSGWKVYDNKGRAVESYEPSFDRGWSYQPPTAGQRGERTRTHYDIRGQVVRTVYPDDSEQRVVHGVPLDLAKPDRYRPTPWEVYTYDQNDNAGRTHDNESKAYEAHWNTPSSAVCDALGRSVRATGRIGPNPASDWFVTRTRYDIRGNVLAVVDPLGRPVLSSVYDLANRALRSESLDAGVERTVVDAAGQPIEGRTATGALALRRFDLLGRPLRVWARDRSGEDVTLRERIEYGDASNPNQDTEKRRAARTANTLGRAVLHFDEAGRIFRSYDFKGNVRAEGRRVMADAQILKAFSPAPPNWKVATYRVDWEPPPGTSFADHAKALLEPGEHTTSTAYDALNRATALQYPKDATGTRRKLDVIYNRAGATERLVLDGTPFVRRIAYNARGQRILVVYDNRLMTRLAYDPKTFRLARSRTEKVEGTGEAPPYKGTGPPLQELGYRYDLAGNVLSADDRTPGGGVEATPHGADRLLRKFEYDALYRLTAATGRVCTNIGAPRPWGDAATCGFGGFDHGSVNQANAPKLTRRYDERYRYDAAGNMLTLAHQPAGTSGWTRRFGVGGMKPADWDAAWQAHLDPNVEWAGAPGNRLSHVGDAVSHFFDEDGNLVRQLSSSHYEWDWTGRMRSFRVQVRASGSEPSEDRWAEPSRFTHYLYDAAGQRVKKLTRTQDDQFETATYIGATFEAHRFRDGKHGTTLQVLDGDRRIVSRRLGNAHPADRSPGVKYQLDDHLGSSVLVVDQGGSWVNREEYSPYGDTTFGGFAKKRYRFTGKERDEESGLCYHGARYYAPWLGRWTSCDPAGLVDGLSLYTFSRGAPTSYIDITGAQAENADGNLATAPGSKLPADFQRLAERWRRADSLSEHASTVSDAFGALWRQQRAPPEGAGPLRNISVRVGFSLGVGDETAHWLAGDEVPSGSVKAEWKTHVFAALGLVFVSLRARAMLRETAEQGKSLQAWVRTSSGTGAPNVDDLPWRPPHGAGGNVPSPTLAGAVKQLQAEGVPLRGNFVNVAPTDPLYKSVVEHGGAFHQHGKIYVNMDVIGRGVRDPELGTLLTPKQILQHEMGHVGQAALKADPRSATGIAEYAAREADASLRAAMAAQDPADIASLLRHSQAQNEKARQVLNLQ
jgi:RHS repeat-associated protein